MQCRSVLIRLDSLRTGELDPGDRKAVEDHLGACRSCRAVLEEITGFAATAPALMAPARAPAVGGGGDARPLRKPFLGKRSWKLIVIFFFLH